ncbi:hypothetical protein EYV94_02850 [Puteibacter caeruleilacunae]|nr:hypothetical protein EYV94_02850 [Puteibacter caeruleilacunae]
MKNLYTRLSIYVVVALLACSCATPKMVLRLKPDANNTKWSNGREIVKDSLNGIFVNAAFDEHVHPEVVFHVEITNYSNLPILVDPAKIYYLALDQNKKLLPNSGGVYSVNPELKLLEIDKEKSRAIARAKNSQTAGIIAAGVVVAASVAIAASDDEDDQDRHAVEALTGLAAANVATTIEEDSYYHSSSLDDLRQFWSSETLRKTTLDPGQMIRGRIVLPATNEATYYQFHIPIDDQYLKMIFKQQGFLP